MDRITRKSLKDDRFAAEVTHSVEFLAGHRRQVLLYGGIGAAVLAVALGGYFWWRRQQDAAHLALYKALRVYHGVISDEEREGRVTFKTEQDKQKKSLQEFESAARNHPRTAEGKIARYYAALVHKDMGKPDEARKLLAQAVGDSPAEVAALARLALAEIHEAQNRPQDARKLYEYLVKNPTSTVPEARAQLALARLLKSSQPEEARKLLSELQKRVGPISVAAGSILREMGPGN